MSRNQKPVVIVAVVLGALIILPVIVLMLTRSGGASSSASAESYTPVAKGEGQPAVDFDLRQLSERVDTLLSKDLADAVRKGDVSLEFMADLQRVAEKGRAAMRAGKTEKAEAYYTEVLNSAEAQLNALKLADQARALNDSTYAELKRMEYLKSAFENTYRKAVEVYNGALSSLNEGDYQASVDGYEMAGAILGDLEARSIQQVGGILESAKSALETYDLDSARTAFQEVLRIDSANAAATEGLVMVQALEGIADEVRAIQVLEEAGKYEAALKQLDALVAEDPNNPFLRNQRKAIEAKILERDYMKLLADAGVAEGEGDYVAAIEALEAAIALKPTAEQQARLADLKEKHKAARLEQLLATGFDALKAGRYEAARDIYKDAVAIDSKSKEARNGLEKASSLYLANIKYSQNIANAAKYVKEGRYPIAAKFFNDAMSSRPSNVPPSRLIEERRLRDILDKQSQEVSLTIDSDKKTYVSIIGVLPPDRFKETDLNLYPDVYTVKGTRKGYRSVEIELKVDATKSNQTITVECTEKL